MGKKGRRPRVPRLSSSSLKHESRLPADRVPLLSDPAETTNPIGCSNVCPALSLFQMMYFSSPSARAQLETDTRVAKAATPQPQLYPDRKQWLLIFSSQLSR